MQTFLKTLNKSSIVSRSTRISSDPNLVKIILHTHNVRTKSTKVPLFGRRINWSTLNEILENSREERDERRMTLSLFRYKKEKVDNVCPLPTSILGPMIPGTRVPNQLRIQPPIAGTYPIIHLSRLIHVTSTWNIYDGLIQKDTYRFTDV